MRHSCNTVIAARLRFRAASYGRRRDTYRDGHVLAQRGSYCFQQFFRPLSFVEVPVGVLRPGRRIDEPGEKQNRNTGLHQFHLACHLCSCRSGKQMVRNNQINLNRAEHLEGVFGVGCGKNLVPRTFEDSFANEESARFIVNAQN